MARAPGLLAFVLALPGPGCGGAPPEAAPADAAVDAARDAEADADASPGDAPADAPGLPPFTGDPWALTDLWEAVPDDHGIGLYQARLWGRPDPFTPRPWTSRGVGCEVAPADPPGFPERPASLWPGADAKAPTSLLDGELHLRILNGTRVEGRPWNDLFVATVRLRDQRTLAAQRSSSLVYGAERSAAFIAPVMDLAGGLRGMRVPLEGGLAAGPNEWWPWYPLPSGLVGTSFAWEGGWGLAVNGRLQVTTAPSDTAFRPIPSALRHAEFDVMGYRDQLVGTATQASILDTLYSYTAATGVVPLYTAPPEHYLWASGVGERYIVWVLAYQYFGAQQFTRAWLCWSPRVTRPEDLVVTTGPELLGSTLLTESPLVGTTHAAVLDANTNRFYVVALDSGRLWTIHRRRDGSIAQLLGVDATYVYLKEYEPDFPTPQLFQRIVRWRLDQLDALEAASQTW